MANTPAIAKKANRVLVINAVRNSGPLTIDGILSIADMSRPTATSIVKELEQQHILKKAGRGTSEVGRQPWLYTIDDSTYFSIGIDIDGPPARLVLIDLDGNTRYSEQWEFEEEASGEQILDRLVEAVESALSAAGVKADSVLGIGLGLPGSVNIRERTLVNVSRLTGLRDLPITERLEGATGIPVFTRNDAHLIALAENVDDFHDYLYVIFRAGVGMAIVLDSEVFEGETGNAGFIGHTCLNPEGPECECGARGCLEAYASKRTIVRRYQEQTGEPASYSDILQRATEGDTVAEATLADAGKWLGLGIGNLIKTLDIYNVVLGELGCNEEHSFFQAIESSASEATQIFLSQRPVLRPGRLQDEDLARGGALSVIDQFFATPRLRLRADSNA